MRSSAALISIPIAVLALALPNTAGAAGGEGCEALDPGHGGGEPGPVVHGRWAGGTETTEYHPGDGYSISRCDRDGNLVEFQEVELIEVDGRRVAVLSGRLAPDPTAAAVAGAQRPLAGAFMNYPDPGATALEDWSRARAGVLPPTPAGDAAPAARSRLGAALRGRCANGSYSTLWRLASNAGYQIYARSLPHGRRSLRRIVQAHKVWNRGRNRCGIKRRTVIRMPYRGRSGGPVERGDGRDYVDFGPLAPVGCLPPALACALPGRAEIAGGTLIPGEVDIRFSRSVRWWSGKGRPPPRRQDVRSTATHEVGHKLGLGHVAPGTRQAMCTPCGIPGTSYRRTLGRGDVIGMRSLYRGLELRADRRH